MTWCKAAPPYGFGVGDYNGDGKADFWCHSSGSGETWVAISGANVVFYTPAASMNWCVGSSLAFGMADFNGGDGRSDVWCFDDGVMSPGPG